MITEIKHILYATDLSENSKSAFLYAAGLAHIHQAQMSVLHVIEEFNASTFMQLHSYFGEREIAEIIEKRKRTLLDEVTQKLNEFCSGMTSGMETCPLILEQITVRTGIPAYEIISQSEQTFADIIVIGTHGYQLVRDSDMGNVARKVIQRSKVPVLVVPPENLD